MKLLMIYFIKHIKMMNKTINTYRKHPQVVVTLNKAKL